MSENKSKFIKLDNLNYFRELYNKSNSKEFLRNRYNNSVYIIEK